MGYRFNERQLTLGKILISTLILDVFVYLDIDLASTLISHQCKAKIIENPNLNHIRYIYILCMFSIRYKIVGISRTSANIDLCFSSTFREYVYLLLTVNFVSDILKNFLNPSVSAGKFPSLKKSTMALSNLVCFG